jgi:signal transduction histidine kinase
VFRHIRYKLIAAFALPLLILVGVAGLEVSSAASQISRVDQEASLAKASVEPGGAVQQLQNEREDAVLSILAAASNLPTALQGITPSAAGITQSPAEVKAATDSALAAFKSSVQSAGDQAQSTYQTAFASLSLLAQARAEWASAGTNTTSDYRQLASNVYSKYTQLIDDLITATSQVPYQVSDPTLRSGVEALVTSLEKTEADWQVTMDLFEASWSSALNQASVVNQATEDYGAETVWVGRLSSLATGPFRAAVSTLVSSTLSQSLATDINLLQSGTPPLMSALLDAFDETAPSGSANNETVVQQGNAEIATAVNQRASQLHNSAVQEAGEFGLAGLLGILVGLLLVALVSRSISKPLVSLARQADELATEHLPATLQAMLASDGVDVPEGPAISVTGHDEVAEVARALDAVKKTAVELAAGQVVLRRNLADAFVNLGRRNQNLVTRQLEYISDIELKESDPESLEELFRLDHLATRMRRNAESLLILAGSGPARQWSAAVPAMDVARAASAEVEDYKRLRLHHFDPAMITGEVTTDLVHILAELIENALTFSPPGSPVDVYGRFLEGGYILVIVDSGIGMSGYDLDIANRRLEGLGSEGEVPGRFLGHFVAGRLAARHGLGISLQASPSGGLVARVRIPRELIEEPVADLSAGAELRTAPAPAAAPPAAAPPAPRPAAPAPTAQVPAAQPPVAQAPTAPAPRPSAPEVAPPAPPVAPAPAPAPAINVTSRHGVTNNGWSDAELAGLASEPDAWSAQTAAAAKQAQPGSAPVAPAPPAAVAAAAPLPAAPPVAPAPAPVQAARPPLAARPSAPAEGVAVPVAPVAAAPAAPPAPTPAPPMAASAVAPPSTPVDQSALEQAIAAATAAAKQADAASVALEPATIELSTDAAPAPTRHEGTPDLGILSPLAGTVSAGGLLSNSQAAQSQAPPAVSADQAPKPSGAAAWNALPPPAAPAPINPSAGIAPAVSAEGLRKLARRVPGAALPDQDESLRRTSPTTTTRNPLGLTGALAQYLSATANDGRAEKGA